METFELNNDIPIICVKARSFPFGVQEAFLHLENLLPSIEGRTFYGISYQDKDAGIIYRAAVQESYEGEAEKLGCESYVIRKGNYLTETLFNWRKNEEMIGKAFMKLLADPRLDLTHPCVEWYKSEEDVTCMVRIDDSKETV